MSEGVALSLRKVSKRFATEAGVVDAVKDVSLQVPASANLAVTGSSGCGKSTLLSMIGALEPPSAGRVQIGEHEVSKMAERLRVDVRRELIGFVFQSDNLQPFLTAVENVSLQLALSGADRGYERAQELLRRLGVGELAGKYPDQLSGGERQRVAVARALVHRPRLILADEPTGALDAENSSAVTDLLLEAQAESGATLIVITHDQAVAARFKRQIGLSDGRIASDSAETGTRAARAAEAVARSA